MRELGRERGKGVGMCVDLSIRGAMISIQAFVRETRRRAESPTIGKGKPIVCSKVEYFTRIEHGEDCWILISAPPRRDRSFSLSLSSVIRLLNDLREISIATSP